MTDRWIERGTEITDSCRIRNLYASENFWQLYSTNTNAFVLAALPEQVNTWVNKYSLPSGVFFSKKSFEPMLYIESENYALSSLEEGPYSLNQDSVETLILAYNRLISKHPEISCSHAIFMERFSLILPTDNLAPTTRNDVILGKWVTHGVGVSLFDKEVSNLAPWLIGKTMPAINMKEKHVQSEKPSEKKSHALPEDKFILKGRPELETFFNDRILDVLKNQEAYEKMGIHFPGATILHGPAGSGKTYAVECFAEFLGWPVFTIDSKTIGSPYIHDTSKKISEVFDQAIKNAPAVLIIDEMDAFLSQRVASEQGMHHNEEVAEFLRRIPEAISKQVLIFAMTNMIELVDNAISRRGRFDYIIEVGMATKQEIEDVLLNQLQKLPISDDIVVPEIAEALDNRPLSDVSFVIKEAGRIAAKNRENVISKKTIDEALKLLPELKQKRKIGFATDKE